MEGKRRIEVTGSGKWYTLAWDEITSTWAHVERRSAQGDKWKEVDPDLKQLGRALADQFPDPPEDTVKTFINGYGHVLDFVPAKSPIEPEPWCLGWAPPGTRSRPRMTKKNLEAERTRPNKMGVPDPAAYANKYFLCNFKIHFSKVGRLRIGRLRIMKDDMNY
ncbi:unnamed protein product [Cuscuta epithymum]|uniref:Uncharacterized protein n=1 Tax=Cuscuta epithymum TaxID=186058 RepID=A0AAV0EM19_9ASTE|nr:unnamed protein product [Cuscuta epithymum]